MRIFDYTHAINSLRPGATWSIIGDEYSSIHWMDLQQDKPTESEIQAEVARLQAEYDSRQYQRQRALEYPPITDYLDGVVKGDQAQIDKYIADCQAVKAKYPRAG
jgi:tRNA A37 N6-isopentenylltransferase MiaA